MASESKKKLVVKNKDLRRRIKAKVKGKADLQQAVKDIKKDAAYWEERACKAEQELAGEVYICIVLTRLHVLCIT